MFVKARAAALLVFAMAALNCFAASASEVDEAIERLEESFRMTPASCVPDRNDVSTLLRAIEATSSEIDQVRGLRWLSTVPFWEAGHPKKEYWKTLNRLAKDQTSYALRYYAGIAMVMQKGELISALRTDDHEGIAYFLRENENTSEVYADLARLAVLQHRLWDHGELSAADDNSAIVNWAEIEVLFDQIFTSSEAREFLKPTSVVQDLELARQLYANLLGKNDRGYYNELIEKLDIKADMAFDPSQGLSQVNSRFMAPGRIVADSLFGTQSRLCASTQAELSQNRFYRLARGQEGRILNPVYAVDHVCRKSMAGATMDDIASTMTDVVNRDYRVIVGHTRGATVRFSQLGPEELQARLEKLVASYAPQTRVAEPEITRCANMADNSFFSHNLDVGRFQPAQGEDGYIYAGTGLTLRQSNHLADFIKQERDFRGAYVFRPVDAR